MGLSLSSTRSQKTFKKQAKLPCSESNSEPDLTKEHFSKFVVFYTSVKLQYREEMPLTKLSPFIIQVIFIHNSHKSKKKKKNGTILIKVTSNQHAEILPKVKNFHQHKTILYPHDSLNTFKGVV